MTSRQLISHNLNCNCLLCTFVSRAPNREPNDDSLVVPEFLGFFLAMFL